MTSAEVREELMNALQLDLVGPTPEGLGDAAERLDQAPSRRYLTGFLVPANAGQAQEPTPMLTTMFLKRRSLQALRTTTRRANGQLSGNGGSRVRSG